MTPEQEVLRGQLAADVLDNPVYQDAYRLTETALIARWRDSKDAAEREDCHKLVRLLDKIKRCMEATMRNGEVEAKEILRKRSLAERMKIGRAA